MSGGCEASIFLTTCVISAVCVYYCRFKDAVSNGNNASMRVEEYVLARTKRDSSMRAPKRAKVVHKGNVRLSGLLLDDDGVYRPVEALCRPHWMGELCNTFYVYHYAPGSYPCLPDFRGDASKIRPKLLTLYGNFVLTGNDSEGIVLNDVPERRAGRHATPRPVVPAHSDSDDEATGSSASASRIDGWKQIQFIVNENLINHCS